MNDVDWTVDEVCAQTGHSRLSLYVTRCPHLQAIRLIAFVGTEEEPDAIERKVTFGPFDSDDSIRADVNEIVASMLLHVLPD